MQNNNIYKKYLIKLLISKLLENTSQDEYHTVDHKEKGTFTFPKIKLSNYKTIGVNTFLTGKNLSSLKISLAINCQRAYQSHEGLMIIKHMFCIEKIDSIREKSSEGVKRPI
ncbi:817_t:CDS:2 [Funneliformis geosporum]|nr:817_t:CDS:2 [Funneliformis geosporum]